MEIYHGSDVIVQKPTLNGGRTDNDYGRGFYCTQSLPLAMEWACKETVRNAFVNKYSIETEGLAICNLSSPDYHVLNWIALLMDNRRFFLKNTNSEQFFNYVIDNFKPDISGYDAIVGYRADDSYFSIARSFLQNEISIKQLSQALKLGNLGEQFVLKSQKAFDRLLFLCYMNVPYEEFLARRMSRDRMARSEFVSLPSDFKNDYYLIDIIRGGWKNDDPRLR